MTFFAEPSDDVVVVLFRSEAGLRLPKSLVASVLTITVVVFVGVLEIKTGFIPMRFSERSKTVSRWNETDVTMTIYGWRKIKPQFEAIRNEKVEAGMMKEDDGMIALSLKHHLS